MEILQGRPKIQLHKAIYTRGFSFFWEPTRVTRTVGEGEIRSVHGCYRSKTG